MKICHKIFKAFSAILLCAALSGCMERDFGGEEDLYYPQAGLLIVNEGNFQYGNSTLSFYDPTSGSIADELFFRANGMRLGDVAQSVTLYGGKAWIVVNNSHVIFAVNTDTFRETGRITNLPSPRHIHFIDDHKAYVTQLWDNRILIIDPSRLVVTGEITVPDMNVESGSTEQMVSSGPYVFCTCWSYQDRVLKIDTRTDCIVGSVRIGIQPRSITTDCNGKIWILTDGGYSGSPYGNEAPQLCRLEPETMTVDRRFRFAPSDSPRGLTADSDGKTIYWINGGVWAMSVNSKFLPDRPVIPDSGSLFYSMTISPDAGDIYVADAIDYQQPGIVYRYSREGELIDKFYAGINPAAFCWKP